GRWWWAWRGGISSLRNVALDRIVPRGAALRATRRRSLCELRRPSSLAEARRAKAEAKQSRFTCSIARGGDCSTSPRLTRGPCCGRPVRRHKLQKTDTPTGRNRMRMAVSRILGTTLASLIMLPALAAAQDHTWRHGIIEAKSDAGFQVMAVRGGFAQKVG